MTSGKDTTHRARHDPSSAPVNSEKDADHFHIRTRGRDGKWPNLLLALLLRVEVALAAIAAVSTLVLLGAILTSSLTRLVYARPVTGIIELSELALLGVGFLALAYTQRCHGHVSFSLVVERLPPAIGRAVNGFALLAAAGVVLLIAVASTDAALSSFTYGEVTLGSASVPVWPGRAVVSLGLWVLAVELLRSAVEAVVVASGGSERDGVTPL